MPQIQCKVIEKETRCTSVLEVPDALSVDARYICRHHTRAAQVRAMNKINSERHIPKNEKDVFISRSYDPVRDEADKDIRFQDVAFDPELGGNVDPISEDGVNHGRRISPSFYTS